MESIPVQQKQDAPVHSSIDILLLQLTVIAVAVIIKLGEDIVPDFHVTVTLAAYNVQSGLPQPYFSPRS